MAYLPMTVVNAMPDVTISVQTQSVTTMDMATMDMADCQHHQATKTCDHCSTTDCVQGSCSISLGVTSHYSVLSNHRNVKDAYKMLHISTEFQHPPRLYRPPISI